jgi:hypothetical protein
MGRPGTLRGAGGDENLKINFMWPYADKLFCSNLHYPVSFLHCGNIIGHITSGLHHFIHVTEYSNTKYPFEYSLFTIHSQIFEYSFQLFYIISDSFQM